MNVAAVRKVAPRGIMIDDDPGLFPQLITEFIKLKHNRRIYLKPLSQASSKKEVLRLVDRQKPHFALIDDRLQNRFYGYPNGVPLAADVLQHRPNIRVFYYSAFQEVQDENGQPRDAAAGALLSNPRVRLFSKSDLDPLTGNIDALTQAIIDAPTLVESLEATAELQNVMNDIKQRLIVARHTRRYRIEHFNGRYAEQIISPLDTDDEGAEIALPTRFLRRAGVTSGRANITIEVIEFSGGEVLSRILPTAASGGAIPSDLRRLLERRR